MSKENLVLKLKLEMETQTAGALDGQSRICNWLYNHLLEKGQELKQAFIQSSNSKAAMTLYTKRGLRNLLPKLKEEHHFLKVVHSSPLKNTALRLSEAIPKWLKTYDKRLDALKSKRDRCNKKSKKAQVLDEKGKPTGKEYTLPSKRWKKYDRSIMRALHKRREQTKTFMFTSAHHLFREYDCIGIGDYTPHGEGITTPMRRAMNNRSLIGRWKETLSWVALKSGKTFIQFDEQGTTRTCNHCLHVEGQGIPVAMRQWQCRKCQTVHIRDENAAINGLRKVLRDLSPKQGGENPPLVSGSDPVFVKERWAWCILPSGVRIMPRGQNSEVICSTRKLNRGHDSPRSKLDDLIIYDQV